MSHATASEPSIPQAVLACLMEARRIPYAQRTAQPRWAARGQSGHGKGDEAESTVSEKAEFMVYICVPTVFGGIQSVALVAGGAATLLPGGHHGLHLARRLI